MRVSQLGLRYVSERSKRQEISRSTRPNLVSCLLRFAESCDDLEVEKVRLVHVERFLEADVAPSTLRGRLSVLRTFFEWARVRKFVRRNPCEGVKLRAEPRRLPRGLQHDAVGSLFSAVPDPRAELICSLMVQEGLRCCEVARLEVADVNWPQRVMLVKGKGGHERVLPITAETWAALDRYGRPSSGHLIRSYLHPSRGISAGQISKIVSVWMSEAGIKRSARDGVSAHALRHTCATDMLTGGAELVDVQAVLGHRNIATTQVYLPWKVKGLDAAMSGRSYRVPVSDPL